MIVDSVVLYQTVLQWNEIQKRSDPLVFHDCYQPQVLMRIIFTCYAINAAGLCFLLTLALAFMRDDQVESFAIKLFTYTYVVFGPVLLICSIYGIIFIKGLLFECEPQRITGTINFMDIFILMGCTVFSSMISLFFSMHQAVEMANVSLRDETSVFYRIFVKYLGYKRRLMREEQQRMAQYQQQQEQQEQNQLLNAQNSRPQDYQAINDREQDIADRRIAPSAQIERIGGVFNESSLISEEEKQQNDSKEFDYYEDDERHSAANYERSSLDERETRATYAPSTHRQ